MSNRSYYYCQHCRESVVLEFTCPCCSLGKPTDYPISSEGNLFDEFFSWLKVHTLGFKMRIDAMDWEIDRGYVKACEVIEAELKRLIEECKDDTTGIKRNKGLLG